MPRQAPKVEESQDTRTVPALDMREIVKEEKHAEGMDAPGPKHHWVFLKMNGCRPFACVIVYLLSRQLKQCQNLLCKSACDACV